MCHHGVWGDFATSESTLKKHRELILPISYAKGEEPNARARRELLLNHLILSNPQRGGCAIAAKEITLLIGSRKVCVPPFVAHWCISKAQLWRYINLVAEYGAAALEKDRDRACGSGRRAEGRRSHKRDYVVTWFMNYAEETTERLPDVDAISLPRMSWVDMHTQYEFEAQQAGVCADRIASMDHFRKTFHDAPELSRYELCSHKRNFGRCGKCVASNAKVDAAIKAHDVVALVLAKGERREHYVEVRAEKLLYH